MKLIRYYTKLIDHYSAVPVGGEAVIVSRIKDQPVNPNCGAYMAEWREGKLQFPIGSIIGMPEIYRKDINKMYFEDGFCNMSPITMPNSAIRVLFEVTGTRVCQIQKVSLQEVSMMGLIDTSCEGCDEIKNCRGELEDYPESAYIRVCKLETWYLDHYPEGSWEKDYVEVTKVKRIERGSYDNRQTT